MLFPNVRLKGTGSYLPERKVSDLEIDTILNKPSGTTGRTSHVYNRHWITDETTSQMASLAAKNALEDAQIDPSELSLIISANAIAQQPLPATAPFIQKELGLQNSGIPAYDINSSCLSHLVALDTLAPHINSGRYKNVLFVSAEMPSIGIHPDKPHSYVLFGDGAAASIFSYDTTSDSGILTSRIETYSSAVEGSQIKGGLTRLPASKLSSQNEYDYYFDMNGKALLSKVFEVLPEFLDRSFKNSNYTLKNADVVIPHQASYVGIKTFEKKFKDTGSKVINIISQYGNMVSASLPFALDTAIKTKEVQRGDKVLLLGTAAGLTVGATMFRY